MLNRSEEQIIQDIRDTQKRLTNLHEELFDKLSLDQTIDKATKPKATSKNTSKRTGRTTLQVGDQVEILTRGIGANKGDIATVTKVNKTRIGIRVNRNGRETQRKPQNLRLVE